jgi:hypothetical protein
MSLLKFLLIGVAATFILGVFFPPIIFLLPIFLIWLHPKKNSNNLENRFPKWKQQKIRVIVSLPLIILSAIAINVFMDQQAEKAFIKNFPEPIITVLSRVDHQGDNTEYMLVFETENSDVATVNGKEIKADQEDLYKMNFDLNKKNTDIQIIASNQYKESILALIISRNETEQERISRLENKKIQEEKIKIEELNKITDSNAYIMSKNFVLSMLKSPSTADFPLLDYQAVKIEPGHWMVQSYVDAQNSFGAMIRNSWIVELKFDGGDWADIRNWTLIDIAIE